MLRKSDAGATFSTVLETCEQLAARVSSCLLERPTVCDEVLNVAKSRTIDATEPRSALDQLACDPVIITIHTIRFCQSFFFHYSNFADLQENGFCKQVIRGDYIVHNTHYTHSVSIR